MDDAFETLLRVPDALAGRHREDTQQALLSPPP
jgi:hypothetical protein